MKHGFEYSNQFNTDSSFASIKFGYDRPILETELNELQEIQNHNRKLLVSKICKSGVVELVDKDFVGDPIVYNPNNELNKIAIAPMKVIINGYEIHVCGNYKIGEINTYIDIDLGDAPFGFEQDTMFRQDLVFLQVWLEEFEGNDEMKRYGHDDGTVIPNTIVDVRVGEETSHRMMLKWKIRTTNIINKYMDFNRWPYGFGFENIGVGNFVRIETDVIDGINIINPEYDKIFANATHYMFKGCMFYGDNNLWIAGRPNRNDPSNTKDTEYVYALPLFRVDRRNKQIFSIENSNGSKPFQQQNINLRPDNKCYDLVYKDDLIDLRKTVIIGDNEAKYQLDSTLNSLFTGQLTTKSNEKMKRLQFGIKPLDKKIDNIIFLESFNKSTDGLTVPEIGDKPVIQPAKSQIKYKPSITEWGLDIDGSYKLSYDMKNISLFNKDEGTIDFFMCPNFNGFDDVEQDILTLYYQSVNNDIESPFLTVKKVNNYDKQGRFIDSKLEIKRFLSTSEDPLYNVINVGINNISKNKFYHFRICWSVSARVGEYLGEFSCYINGKLVGNSLDKYIDRAINVPIHKMVIGSVNNDINSGFIIDELSIYKKALFNSEWKIPQDFIDNNSIILPSFNGVFRNYRSNQFEQENCVNYIQTIDGSKTLKINAPYGTLIGHKTPKIYCLKRNISSVPGVIDGRELKGTWVGLGTESLTFSLNENDILNFNSFSGEIVAVVYSIIITGKNNIDDIPNEILRSEICNTNTGETKEVSFNIENNTGKINDPRQVSKLVTINKDEQGRVTYEPVRNIYNVHDTAYDFSTFRNNSGNIINNDFAFSRLLEYYVEGNNRNTYFIDKILYGYEVSYIKKAYIITSDMKGIEQQTPINILDVRHVNNQIRITISDVIMSGIKIKFEIGLCGLTFDYNSNSKTYVGNMCKAYLLEFTATGGSYEYVIPLNKLNDGVCQHGVITSIAKQYNYNIDDHGKVSNEDNPNFEYICYNNGVQQKYELLEGLGKPFIKIRIEEVDTDGAINTVPLGAKITIPVFVTYQCTSSDVLSIWYNYTPYQGIMDISRRKVKRLSDWKCFITTLSSSSDNDKYNNKYSLNNLINRLPGGATSSSHITGQPINLKGHYLNEFSEMDNYEINKNLIFVNQSYIGTKDNDIDKAFFDLKTLYNINKQFGSIQDDKINIDNYDFSIYFQQNECSDENLTGPINRYCGMASIVVDEYGDLYLFVVGDTNNNIATINNFISPVFGDLFIIPNRPSLQNRS